MKVGLVSFTPDGAKTAQKLLALQAVEFVLYEKAQGSLKDFVSHCFSSRFALVFVGAAGIAVRLIAPLLRAKNIDPAVVVIDEKGRFVIPLLSGHIGGANKLAHALAKELGATPVITTATDLNNVWAADVWAVEAGCAIPRTENIKHLSSALLAGKEIGLASDFERVGSLPAGLSEHASLPCGICVTLDDTKQPFLRTLTVVPRIVTIGVGCRKETDPQAFEAFLLKTLKNAKISPWAVEAVASIDLKRGEKCITDFCKKYDLPFLTYTAQELTGVSGQFTPSEFVQKVTGTDNVCERAAAAAGGGLILRKQAKSGITAALAQRNWRCEF